MSTKDYKRFPLPYSSCMNGDYYDEFSCPQQENGVRIYYLHLHVLCLFIIWFLNFQGRFYALNPKTSNESLWPWAILIMMHFLFQIFGKSCNLKNLETWKKKQPQENQEKYMVIRITVYRLSSPNSSSGDMAPASYLWLQESH